MDSTLNSPPWSERQDENPTLSTAMDQRGIYTSGDMIGPTPRYVPSNYDTQHHTISAKRVCQKILGWMLVAKPAHCSHLARTRGVAKVEMTIPRGKQPKCA